MSVFAELHDGRRLEFPDGTDPAVIQRTVKRVLGGQAQQPAQPDVADEYGPAQAATIAGGRTLERIAAGMRQMTPEAIRNPIDRLGRAMGMAEPPSIDPAQQQADTAAFAKLEARHPVSTMLGGAAPLLAAPALGTGVAGMAAGAALPGLMEYGTPEERLQRGALGAAGGAVGALAGKALGRVVQPVRAAPDAARAEAIKAAERIGYKVPIGQQTGSRSVQTMEQQLAKNPVTAGMAQKLNEANQQSLNRAVGKAMGENADTLTDSVLDAAKSRIGAVFDDVASRTKITVSGDDLLGALVKLDEQQSSLGSFANPKVTKLIDKGLDLAAQGQVEGRTYQLIRSELGNRAEAAFNGKNATLGNALKAVQQSLDDAANSSISPADRQAWELARKQWQAYKIASKRMGVIEGGNVSAAKLSTRVDKTRGRVPQEIADVAKIGETFKPLPDSGTASNAFAQMLLTGGAGLLGPGPLAATIGGPLAAQKFLQSSAGQRYLTQGMTKVTPEMERMLMLLGAGTGSVGGGLLGRR